jgi:Putative esterase
VSGSYRVAETYSDDQYSEITVTATPSVWIAASVRNQPGGDLYLGLYVAGGPSSYMLIFKRISGAYTQFGSPYTCGILPVGTKLRLMVVGGTLAFMQDGIVRNLAYDTSITSGAPGIAIAGDGAVDDWTGGNATFDAKYLSTDADGVESYAIISRRDGHSLNFLRVLRPTSPAPGMAHQFLYVLPVEPEGSYTFGDGLSTLRLLNAPNAYNVTIIAPSFSINPWYADHPTDSETKYESFMSLELQPWVTANLASTGSEQHWLLGFSRSGFGGLDLLLKHPDLFTLGAFWDFPAQGFTAYDQLGDSASNYGTDANFQSNYRLTDAFLDAHKTSFLTSNRIFISGYSIYQTEVSNFDSTLTTKGILHTYPTAVNRGVHSWNSGWVPEAVDGLYQNSIHLGNP